MNNIKKKKNSENRDRSAGVFLGWLVVSFLWFWLAYKACHLPNLHLSYSEFISYRVQLSQHSIGLINNPFFVFVVSNIIAFILLVRTKKWLLILFMIPFEIVACYAILAAIFGCDGYALHHRDTARFDGKTFHLTYSYDTEFDDYTRHILILYECQTNRDLCRGRMVDEAFSGSRYNRANLVVENNQLLVLSARDEVLFTLDKISRNLPLPNLDALSISNIDGLQSFGDIHYDTTQDMKWLPDNRTLVTAGNRAIWFHDLTGDTITTRNLPIINTSGIAVSPDGRYIASTSHRFDSSPTTVWNIERLTEIFTLPNSGDVVDFSANGRFFATTHNKRVALYDTEDFLELGVLSNRYEIEELVFSPDSQFLAATGGINPWGSDEPDFVRVWDVETQEELFVYNFPIRIYSKQIAFSPNSQRLAFMTSNGNERNNLSRHIWIFDFQAHAEWQRITLPLSVRSINDILWSSDETVLIASSGSRLLFWNPETGELVHMIESSGGDLALSNDGTLLASELHGGAIRFWGVPADK